MQVFWRTPSRNLDPSSSNLVDDTGKYRDRVEYRQYNYNRCNECTSKVPLRRDTHSISVSDPDTLNLHMSASQYNAFRTLEFSTEQVHESSSRGLRNPFNRLVTYQIDLVVSPYETLKKGLVAYPSPLLSGFCLSLLFPRFFLSFPSASSQRGH